MPSAILQAEQAGSVATEGETSKTSSQTQPVALPARTTAWAWIVSSCLARLTTRLTKEDIALRPDI